MFVCYQNLNGHRNTYLHLELCISSYHLAFCNTLLRCGFCKISCECNDDDDDNNNNNSNNISCCCGYLTIKLCFNRLVILHYEISTMCVCGCVVRRNRNTYALLLLSMLKSGYLDGPFVDQPQLGPLPVLPHHAVSC